MFSSPQEKVTDQKAFTISIVDVQEWVKKLNNDGWRIVSMVSNGDGYVVAVCEKSYYISYESW